MDAVAKDRRFWDKAARKYAASPIADMEGYERTLARTRAHLKGDHAVLEFGCGTGTTAIRLAPSVAHYLGTDISPEMIAIAREKALAEGVANVRFEAAALDDAAWPDGAFDAALGFNILHLVKDRPAALARIRRALKPGGLLITKTVCLSEMNPLFRVLVPLMQAVGAAPSVSFVDGAALEREIEAAGFAILVRERHGAKKRDPRPFIVAQRA
ncbi:MAG: class I SAM-dependent methyltransferase [Hydrogenophilaceae bacterium]|jgi:ubiquinone/menaquinone biosynthesis C-methylase UbiE|nr:class I SAM-dependent methyltransferase [Hydrogenophilaceae bacterium]